MRVRTDNAGYLVAAAQYVARRYTVVEVLVNTQNRVKLRDEESQVENVFLTVWNNILTLCYNCPK